MAHSAGYQNMGELLESTYKLSESFKVVKEIEEKQELAKLIEEDNKTILKDEKMLKSLYLVEKVPSENEKLDEILGLLEDNIEYSKKELALYESDEVLKGLGTVVFIQIKKKREENEKEIEKISRIEENTLHKISKALEQIDHQLRISKEINSMKHTTKYLDNKTKEFEEEVRNFRKDIQKFTEKSEKIKTEMPNRIRQIQNLEERIEEERIRQHKLKERFREITENDEELLNKFMDYIGYY